MIWRRISFVSHHSMAWYICETVLDSCWDYWLVTNCFPFCSPPPLLAPLTWKKSTRGVYPVSLELDSSKFLSVRLTNGVRIIKGKLLTMKWLAFWIYCKAQILSGSIFSFRQTARWNMCWQFPFTDELFKEALKNSSNRILISLQYSLWYLMWSS